MRRPIVAGIVVLTFFFMHYIASASESTRIALVMGNSTYLHVPSLVNPTNDATDIAQSLRRIGFSVEVLKNGNRKEMRAAIDSFGTKIRGATIALVYFAGHGVQLGGENYLVPTDADVGVAGDIPDECIPVSRITGRMDEAEAGTNVIILDACRDNPFGVAKRGIDRGLAMLGNRPPESIIVYAAAENSKAEDATGRNGTFTGALLASIEKQQSFTDVLYSVKDAVRKATNNRQQPAVYDNLTHPIFLAGSPRLSGVQDTSSLSTVATYGAIKISSVSAGTLYLDGQEKGVLPGGHEGMLERVSVGNHQLELRYGGGDTESVDVIVAKDETSLAVFEFKVTIAKAVVVPSQTTTSASNLGTFTRGSTSDEVLSVMGTPTGINTYQSLGYEEWSYKYSTVRIDLWTKKVVSWNNSSGNLQVSMRTPSTASAFTRGSTSDEVLSAMGTPNGINTYQSLGYEEWSYKYSTVRIDLGTKKVVSWNNSSGNLQVFMGSPTSGYTFTRGSTSDEVLSAMGTPTGINTYQSLGYEEWSYKYSTVRIDLGTKKVVSWNDSSRNLRTR